MGLSAFSRARVSMLEEMEMEAERFEAWNKRHQATVRIQDNTYNPEQQAPPALPEQPDNSMEEMEDLRLACVEKIGEKVEAGLAENTAEGDAIDLPLRMDHVRDMVGRRHVEDPQGEPKPILERLHERIPTSAGASEALANKTQVDLDGPTKEEMDAAIEEQQPWEPPVPELPAAGDGAGVQGEAVGATSSGTNPSLANMSDADLAAAIKAQGG